MIARVIENWLDSTTEREYETPFCQALAAQRYRIIHRSSHGPAEQGKDLICLAPDGCYHAYQLKTGDISLDDWRKIMPEIQELVSVPIQHPNVPPAVRHKSFLVTSGDINDPVKLQIIALNERWRAQGDYPLEVINKGHLHHMFLELQGEVLTSEPVEFERFLRLFLSEKNGCLDKEDFSLFLESLVRTDTDYKRSVLRRLFAASAVVGSLILTGYQKGENHLALAEGWLMVTSYLMRLAETARLYETVWMPSLLLCVEAWEKAVLALVEEALNKEHWLEGDYLADMEVLDYRSTLLLGYLSAFSLYLGAKGERRDLQDAAFSKVANKLRPKHGDRRPFGYWGESASPFLYATALFMQSRGQEKVACEIASSVVDFLCRSNGPSTRPGIPDPYYGPESVLRMTALGEQVLGLNQSFSGQAFTLKPFVQFLARRERKAVLRSFWPSITLLNQCEFVPETNSDTYRWRNKKGCMELRFWRQPEQWGTLLAESNYKDTPRLLLEEKFSPLILPYLLVYPHRMNSRLSRLAEAAFLR